MAGLSKRGSTYYVTWRDSHGIVRRRSTGCKDKSAAEKVKRQIEHELLIDRHDPIAKWRRIPLKEHAKDYRDYQRSIGTGQKQTSQVYARINRIINEAGIRNASELTVSRITITIDRLRMVPQSPNRRPETYPTLSLRTKNFYAKSIKQLTAWMVREGRLERDPLLHIPMRKIETDIRHDRRALNDGEFCKLVCAAENSKTKIEGMSGADRAFLYTLARFTGLRRGELASLSVESFVLNLQHPYLVIEAAYSKHRERDTIPLHPDVVPVILKGIALLVDGSLLFPLLKQRKTAKMIRHDLKQAGIAYCDEHGKFADFHALRHGYITKLWESGARPDVIMSLARHRSLEMTMRYSHTDQSARIAAINSLTSPLADDAEQP